MHTIKNRNDIFDIMKCLAILLVVLGHSIPDASSPNGISEKSMGILFAVIYSFHMPVFFFISGYFSKFIIKNKIIFIKNKFIRLMLPYFIVGLCYFPFKLLLSKYANNPIEFSAIFSMPLGKNPDGELWFLYSLFIISIICSIAIPKINSSILIISFFVSHLKTYISDIEIVSNTLQFQFYFLLGRFFSENELLNKNMANPVVLLGIFLFGNLVNLYEHHYFRYVKEITALSGIGITYFLSAYINKSHLKTKKYIIYLGVISMDIYIFSDIIKIPFRIILYSKLDLYYTSLITCFIFSVVLSILVGYIIRRNNILKLLFLGVKDRNP